MTNQNTPPKLLDQVRDRICVKHYSIRTETQYVQWIKRFILFHNKRHPQEMGTAEIEAFLTHLAVDGQLSASTQNQALSALLFLYKEVPAIDLPWLNNVVRTKQPQRLPVVLTRNERRTWADGEYVVRNRVRLMECVRLRVKDLDFERNEIVIRDGKGLELRHHIDEKLLQRAMKKAVQAARITKPPTPHTMRLTPQPTHKSLSKPYRTDSNWYRKRPSTAVYALCLY